MWGYMYILKDGYKINSTSTNLFLLTVLLQAKEIQLLTFAPYTLYFRLLHLLIHSLLGSSYGFHTSRAVTPRSAQVF